ncbi:MAG: ferritin-like domain-containing protein [Pseudomonadota bacterium]
MNVADRIIRSEEWPEPESKGAPALGPQPPSLQIAARAALSAADLQRKIEETRRAARLWFSGTLPTGADPFVKMPNKPGRPDKPALVAPSRLKKRSIRSEKGRFALLHAIAHIELNAVDLAWDVIGRFCTAQRMPRSFYDGWVRVALEEAKHFSLLRARLGELGGDYGDLEAHDGLWEASRETGHDLTARLAIVPLILESRGLDISPSIIRQMEDVGDEKSATIFRIIMRDEEGHVAVGAKWFRFLCQQEGRPPAATFQALVRQHFRGPLKPPFNEMARARAGLTPDFYRVLSSAGT